LSQKLSSKSKDGFTIWKYPLLNFPVLDLALAMPKGSRILTVQMQGNQPCLWALVDQNAPKVTYHFTIVGTGWEIGVADAGGIEYIGTFQTGSFVWHVFRGVQ
jgi:hypothetical protein